MSDPLIFFIIVVALPVAFATLGTIATRWMKLKEKQLEHAALLAGDKAVTQASHLEKLEQRMRVLERIATDRGVDVAAEIERLREDRVN